MDEEGRDVFLLTLDSSNIINVAEIVSVNVVRLKFSSTVRVSGHVYSEKYADKLDLYVEPSKGVSYFVSSTHGITFKDKQMYQDGKPVPSCDLQDARTLFYSWFEKFDKGWLICKGWNRIHKKLYTKYLKDEKKGDPWMGVLDAAALWKKLYPGKYNLEEVSTAEREWLFEHPAGYGLHRVSPAGIVGPWNTEKTSERYGKLLISSPTNFRENVFYKFHVLVIWLEQLLLEGVVVSYDRMCSN